MDRIIAPLSFQEDGDLRLCVDEGVAYQWDQSVLVPYDAAYFDKYVSYEGSETCNKLNAGRVAFVNKYTLGPVVDIGIGSGEFIRHRYLTWGYDVNPAAVRWLHQNRLWADELHSFDGYTMFDVLEHVPDPNDYLQHIKVGGFLFVSIPLFEDLWRIRDSKHYRPNEHLLYFSRRGFLWYLGQYGFECLEESTFEIDAGREEIYSFAFRRVAKHG